MHSSFTPNASRLHIALFGKRNSGKSSLINVLTGQDTALVSDTPGTTTDPVQKAMEIHGIGPCLFIDTPGFDDEGKLGNMRIERTWKAVEKTDIAILLCAGDASIEIPEDADFTEELHWLEQLKAKNIPTILLINKADIRKSPASLATRIKETFGNHPLLVSAKERTGIELIRQAILEKLPEDYNQQSITGRLVTEGDLVLLVMPQDIQAPKGRLILPQVQTMRELLDKKCLIMSCTTDKLSETLQALARPPKLIITDSQVFKTVYEQKPTESRLTSFSVLFAGYKGDIGYYVESVSAIDSRSLYTCPSIRRYRQSKAPTLIAKADWRKVTNRHRGRNRFSTRSHSLFFGYPLRRLYVQPQICTESYRKSQATERTDDKLRSGYCFPQRDT